MVVISPPDFIFRVSASIKFEKDFYMKFNHILISLILAIGFQVQADQESKWYIGTQYGLNTVSSTPDRKPETMGLIGGYRFFSNFTMEAGYIFGTTGYSNFIIVNGEEKEYQEEIVKQTFMVVKAAYPVSSFMNLHLLAGLSDSEYEITTSGLLTDTTGITTQIYPVNINVSQAGFTYGLGADYRINNRFFLFFNYKVLPDLSVVSGMNSSWKSTDFGVKYFF